MSIEYFPEVVQVIPHLGYTVSVYFSDGKIVIYNANHLLDKGVFQILKNEQIFLDSCTVMNDTLAWDINNGDVSSCLDIDPETIYELEGVTE